MMTAGLGQGKGGLFLWALVICGLLAVCEAMPASAQEKSGDQLRRSDRGAGPLRRDDDRCEGRRCRPKPRARDALIVDGRGKRRGHYATITRALENVRPYGTIYVRPKYYRNNGGFYRESLVINKPVEIIGEVNKRTSPTSHVRIEPDPGTECAVIETHGTVVLANLDWVIPEADYVGNADCIVARAGRIEIRNNYVTGRDGGAAIRIGTHASVLEGNEITLAGRAIRVELKPVERRRRTDIARDHAVRDNLIYQTGHGIVLTSEDPYALPPVPMTMTVSGNRVLGVAGNGIVTVGLRDLTMEHNVLERIGRDGITLSGVSGTITSNVVVGCGRNGMTISSLSPRTKVYDNRIRGCGEYGIFFESQTVGRFANNRAKYNKECAGPRREAKRSGLDLRETCKD